MLHHLIELRRRVIYTLICFLLLFILFFFASTQLFTLIMYPLVSVLPNGVNLITTQVTAPVFVQIKLAFHFAVLATIPVALLQTWYFISPGLYPIERKYIFIISTFSILLFISGLLFCYYSILPYMFYFFIKSSLPQVQLLPDITYSLDFISRMLMLFGLCFQLPLVCFILTRVDVLTLAQLKAFRPYVIVASFTIGMLLTPPDVISQLMLAIPLCILYELGLFLSKFSTTQKMSRVEKQENN